MAITIGIALALVVALFARVVGFDRDRAFYAVVLMVVAHYYVLFALMSGSMSALLPELVVMVAFVAAVVAGFKSSGWIIIAGLAAHGVLDSFHGHVITNPGVPAWWPAFCGSYDVCAAAILALLSVLREERVQQAEVHA